jgi:hypothetical protein
MGKSSINDCKCLPGWHGEFFVHPFDPNNHTKCELCEVGKYCPGGNVYGDCDLGYYCNTTIEK